MTAFFGFAGIASSFCLRWSGAQIVSNDVMSSSDVWHSDRSSRYAHVLIDIVRVVALVANLLL